MIIFINNKIPNQNPEEYYGNREYKLLLSNELFVHSKKENKLVPFIPTNKKTKINESNKQQMNKNDGHNTIKNSKQDIPIVNDLNSIENNIKKESNKTFDYKSFSNQLNILFNLFTLQSDQKIQNMYSGKLRKREKTYDKRLQKRVTQLMFRLNEGKGKAIYIVGISDDGKTDGVRLEQIFDSIYYLNKMKNLINATIKCYRIYSGTKGFLLTARVTLLPFKEIEYFS